MDRIFSLCTAGFFLGMAVLIWPAVGESQARTGDQVFQSNCASCHGRGGNVVNPRRPLKGSAMTKDFNAFLGFVRKPQDRMPAFSPYELPDGEAETLYKYIITREKEGWK